MRLSSRIYEQFVINSWKSQQFLVYLCVYVYIYMYSYIYLFIQDITCIMLLSMNKIKSSKVEKDATVH